MTNQRSLFKNQDYYKLKKDCLHSGELFYDEFFELDVKGAMWLRPHKIVKNPKFFVDGASRFDVIQGANAGCWLLVAIANLTMNPALFHHVVPKDQSFTEDYAGIFRFNIWQCGKWVEVVIDDRLPTKDSKGTRKLMFVHSKQENEFWSALLEKAYAKLYGSYNELTSGWFNEGMVDLTGGIVERVSLKPPPYNLERIICHSLKKSSFMCVFMVDDPSIKEFILPNGLVKGHAYSVNKAQIVHQGGRKVCLFRLRNPWGKIEWKGAWSDSSPEWDSIPHEEKRKIGLVSDNDGEFWISLSDFGKNFEYIDICHLTPDFFNNTGEEDKIGWESHSFKGEWTKGVTAGGFNKKSLHLNPQYRVTLTDVDDDADDLCTVLIGLMQRNKTRKVWRRIGFTAFRLDGQEKESKKSLSQKYIKSHFHDSLSSDFRTNREVVVRDKWEPGAYCIIPSTYKPNEESQFLLRVYSEKKASMEEHERRDSIGRLSIIEDDEDDIDEPTTQGDMIRDTKIPQGKRFLQKNEQEVSEYFNKIAGDDDEIGWHGLQSVLEYALSNAQSSEVESLGFLSKIISWLCSSIYGLPENKIFSKDECRNMITLMDEDRSGRMSLKEFQVLWKKLQGWEMTFVNYCQNLYMDSTDLSKALTEVGHNVKASDVSRLVRKYSDNYGKLGFDDFVMCCIEINIMGTS